ncbi:MAG: hypothetical protein M5U08_13860 [Burkholderiales bacterium]|nr:hypothetical protein [Burkholderiales bacterium]
MTVALLARVIAIADRCLEGGPAVTLSEKAAGELIAELEAAILRQEQPLLGFDAVMLVHCLLQRTCALADGRPEIVTRFEQHARGILAFLRTDLVMAEARQ